jgi:alpha-beta hydrolase superfamily lysophospholipase
MAHLVDELDLPDFAFFAWDARGHGRSRGEVGNSASLATSVRDVQDFVDHIATTYEIATEDFAIVAQSVGAALVAAWAHDYAPRIRCLVLASPAFKVKLYLPFARSLLKLRYALFGHFFVNSYVKARFLTHDPKRVASYEADPHRPADRGQYPASALRDRGADRRRCAADVVPTQLLISGADWVSTGMQHRFYERLGTRPRAPCARLLHDTWARDRARDRQGARLHPRLLRRGTGNCSLLDADRMSYTRDEADAGDVALVMARLTGIDRLAMRSAHGVPVSNSATDRLRSGSTLDYVYRNQPKGAGPRPSDRQGLFPRSIGWRGIRQRKSMSRSWCARRCVLADRDMPVHVVTSPPVTAAMCSRCSPAAP